MVTAPFFSIASTDHKSTVIVAMDCPTHAHLTSSLALENFQVTIPCLFANLCYALSIIEWVLSYIDT